MNRMQWEWMQPGRRGRHVLPLVVSAGLVIIATVYPFWAIVVLTVPLGSAVAVSLSAGIWRRICRQLALAILLLGVGGLAASSMTDGYGAVAACLPAVLAALLSALCSNLPSRDAASYRRIGATAATCSGVAALLVLVEGLHALFYPLYAADRTGSALTYAVLLVAAPGLILLTRLAVPWTGRAATNAYAAAVAAVIAGFASAFLFGRVPDPAPVSLAAEIVTEVGAIILLVRVTVLGARAISLRDDR